MGVSESCPSHPLLYRAWSKLRFQQLSQQLTHALAPLRLGGQPGVGSEILLLSLTQETTPKSHPYGASLDFAEAFESVDWQITVPLLTRAGVPAPVVRALASAWAHQQRWVTFGAHVDPWKIQNVLVTRGPLEPLLHGLGSCRPSRKDDAGKPAYPSDLLLSRTCRRCIISCPVGRGWKTCSA